MGEKINLRDFDILGIITLNDVQGIENYVTPVIENGEIKTYLSRSKEYYNVKTMLELALERDNLKKLLTSEPSKRNFVILENMLNCSAKVYFKKFQQYIASGKEAECEAELQKARDCLMEDVTNIISVMENKGSITKNYNNTLPVGYENSEKRAIEMDNKAILYMFAKSLDFTDKQPQNLEVLTPGYGSLYIGPFLKAMHGYDFTNMLKSKYIEENNTVSTDSVSSLISSDRIYNDGTTVLVIDDNIGTGATMQELKGDLEKRGIKDIISGAIQFNWRNYYRVSTGDKKEIDRFEIDNFDVLSPLNYAGHKLYKHAISQLISSGKEYMDYLQSKSYRRKEYSDLKGAMIRGISCAYATGLSLSDNIEQYVVPKSLGSDDMLDIYKDGPTTVSNPTSKKIIKNVISNINQLDRTYQQDNSDDAR